MRRAVVGLVVAGIIGLLLGCRDGAADHGPPLASLLRSTVHVTKGEGHGSGMIIGSKLVLTAHHAVRGNRRPSIRFFGGQSVTGRVIWSAPGRDLALVGVDIPEGYPVAAIDCDDLSPGEPITVVGHPLKSEWVTFQGNLPKTEGSHDRYVSVGLKIGQGASGGPVFNNDGQVVGILLSILTRRLYDRRGIGYMLPAADFCQTIREKRASRDRRQQK